MSTQKSTPCTGLYHTLSKNLSASRQYSDGVPGSSSMNPRLRNTKGRDQS